ncbi:SDR family oxidoreductase [Pseudomonas sp. RIT-PI-S]|uniref:UDP-glucose 4-epimerase family protein n=1 Tax=Pseudomonas sp. RIT-PI-S TaxID=3035295 RepID=UPI0021D7FB5F|nr:SDR family oxidoreductase [Pseudomonas sp. RIT-PI-S]
MTVSVLLTGATGFVGGAILKDLVSRGLKITVSTRGVLPVGYLGSTVHIGALDGDTNWGPGLKGVDVVVHSAARVHVMREQSKDALSAFRRVNVEGTLNLARQAVKAGIKRFIFISSIKVNGESTTPGNAYKPDDAPAPVDAYGISKMEAELGLKKLAEETGLEIVIIRPVLVYGPGVKANFLRMMHWLKKGIPLPFGAIDNRRSLVALENLANLVGICVNHPAAANQTFLVSDGEDLSTTELLKRMATALGRPAYLIPVPPIVLRAMSSLLGMENFTQRLCGSLQVDISKTCELLAWSPPMSVADALVSTANYDRNQA